MASTRITVHIDPRAIIEQAAAASKGARSIRALAKDVARHYGWSFDYAMQKVCGALVKTPHDMAVLRHRVVGDPTPSQLRHDSIERARSSWLTSLAAVELEAEARGPRDEHECAKCRRARHRTAVCRKHDCPREAKFWNQVTPTKRDMDGEAK